MTAPLSVDPVGLASTGATVGGEGEAIVSAIGALDSALSGAGAMFGHDAAGLVFAQSYMTSGNALLDAAASAVNACRRVGFGIQTSAANYGHANASSTVGGGTSPVLMPSNPAQFSAPGMPPPLGGGIAEPALWTVVEAFVGDVWPDGNPGQLRAAAGAWRQFGTAIGELAGQLNAAGPGLSAQQIPEAGQMVSALGQICGGLGGIASQSQAVATAVDDFANAVAKTQIAVRALLHQISPAGILQTVGGIFSGHNPIDEIRKVAHQIKTVLDNMKRQADATGEIVSQGIDLLDSATNSLEAWANKEFTSALGREVGGVLSFYVDAAVDLPEGGFKFVAETAQGLSQLDPSRFAYDPDGAAKTWQGMLETTTVMLNPVLLAGAVASDPSGSLDTVKGLVDWKDVEEGHLFRAIGYDTAQVASAFIPGVGEAKPAIVASQVEGRAAATSAEVEARAAAGATREAVPGLAGTAASENATTAAGRVSTELNGIKVPESTVATPGATAPVARAPVDGVLPPVDGPPPAPGVETPAPGASESGLAPERHAPVLKAEPAPTSGPPHGSPVDVPPRPHHEGPTRESPAGSPHSTTEQSMHRAADGRPVWSNGEHGPTHGTPHDHPSEIHSPSSDAHDPASWADGIGPDGRVKLSGHGSYNLADGVTTVPEGTTITVYAEHGSVITDELGNLIESGGDTSKVYSRTYYPGEEMPNYTLHPPDGLDIVGTPWTAEQSTKLSEILKEQMGDVDFAACLHDPTVPNLQIYDVGGVYDGFGKPLHQYDDPIPDSSWHDDALGDDQFDEDPGDPTSTSHLDQFFNSGNVNWDYSKVDHENF